MAFPRHQGGRRARVHLSWSRDRLPIPLKGTPDSWPDTKNPLFNEARERCDAAALGADEWHDPAPTASCRTSIAMGQTAENVVLSTGISREDQDRWGVRSQNRAEEAINSGFFAREISPVTLPDGSVVSTDDGPRAAPPMRRSAN